MVEYLNRLFSEFDALARELDVEKIKTIGDAYIGCRRLARAKIPMGSQRSRKWRSA